MTPQNQRENRRVGLRDRIAAGVGRGGQTFHENYVNGRERLFHSSMKMKENVA